MAVVEEEEEEPSRGLAVSRVEASVAGIPPARLPPQCELRSIKGKQKISFTKLNENVKVKVKNMCFYLCYIIQINNINSFCVVTLIKAMSKFGG